MIQNELTHEKYGYKPTELSDKSNRPVIVTCDYCGVSIEKPWWNVFKGRQIVAKDSCPKCVSLKRKEIYSKRTPEQIAAIREKAAATNRKKYGTDSPLSSSSVRAKIKQTCVERYGTDCVLASPTIKSQIRQTNLQKRGVEYPTQSPEVREKVCQTNLERYGVEHTFNSSSVRAKTVETWIKNYGVDNPSKSPEIQKRIEQTNLQNHGVRHVAHSSSISAKIKATLLANHGVDSPFKSPVIREKARQTVISKYGVDHIWKSPSVQQKCRQTMFDVYGTFHPNQLTGSTEAEVREWINSLGYNLVQDQKALDGTELDGYDSEKKIAVEYCGLFWHNEGSLTPRTRQSHRRKYLACRDKGIRLFTIFDYEWLERNDQVKGFLRAALAPSTQTRLEARKCDIREVDYRTSAPFYDQNHIQGRPAHSSHLFTIGLFNGLELVGCVSFGKHHRKIRNGERAIILTRLCWKSGYTVVGGSQRLLAEAKRIIGQRFSGCSQIISWSDNRWSNGAIYENLGFKTDTELDADYFYYNPKTHQRQSKQSFQKKKIGATPEQTEHEKAAELGFYRVWDCGRTRWQLDIPPAACYDIDS